MVLVLQQEENYDHTDFRASVNEMHSSMRNGGLDDLLRSFLVKKTNGNPTATQTHLQCQAVLQTDPVHVITFIESNSASLPLSGLELVPLQPPKAASVQLGCRKRRLWCPESRLNMCLQLNKSRVESCGNGRLMQGGNGWTSSPQALGQSEACASYYTNTARMNTHVTINTRMQQISPPQITGIMYIS